MGHLGVFKTSNILTVHFAWPHMRREAEITYGRCLRCTPTEATSQPHGLYSPLPFPYAPWEESSTDSVNGLLRTQQGKDSICIVADQSSQKAPFLPCRQFADAEYTADLLIKEPDHLPEVPPLIVSDLLGTKGLKKDEITQWREERVRPNLARRPRLFANRANRRRRPIIFDPGGWVWLRQRKERGPNSGAANVHPYGEGPVQVLTRLPHSAYRLDLLGESTLSLGLNNNDRTLSRLVADLPDSRTNHFEEREYDVCSGSQPSILESPNPTPEPTSPILPNSPLQADYNDDQGLPADENWVCDDEDPAAQGPTPEGSILSQKPKPPTLPSPLSQGDYDEDEGEAECLKSRIYRVLRRNNHQRRPTPISRVLNVENTRHNHIHGSMTRLRAKSRVLPSSVPVPTTLPVPTTPPAPNPQQIKELRLQVLSLPKLMLDPSMSLSSPSPVRIAPQR